VRRSEIAGFQRQHQPAAADAARPWDARVDLWANLDGLDAKSADDRAGGLAARYDEACEAFVDELLCGCRKLPLDERTGGLTSELRLHGAYVGRIIARVDQNGSIPRLLQCPGDHVRSSELAACDGERVDLEGR